MSHSLRMIFSRRVKKDDARLLLARWYDRVDNSGFVSFNTIAGTIYEHYEEMLNYFVNRSTNAFAESFNAKIKAFRTQLRGVTDLKFFLYNQTFCVVPQSLQVSQPFVSRACFRSAK